MPFFIALLGALAAGYYFWRRSRNAANIATELMDVANDVRLAARRFGFKRQADIHPVEAVEDPRISSAALALAFIELDGPPTRDQLDGMRTALADEFALTTSEADEMVILGRWLVSQCGGAIPAVSRLARRTYKLSGVRQLEPLMRLVQAGVSAGSGSLSPRQREALDEVQAAMRLR